MPGSIRRYKLHSEIDENESKVQKSKYGLFAFFFFYFAGIGLLNTFLPIHWQKSGFTFAQIGAFNTSSAIAGGIALLPVSALSDRKRHRHLFVIVGAITSAICAILLEFVHHFQGIVVIQAFSGVAMSVGMSLAGAMCADAFQSRNAGKGFGSARAGGTFGYLLVMGLLLFVSLSVRNWLSFNLSSLCFLFAAASIALAPRPKNLAISPHADFRGLVGVLHNSSSIAFILCYFLMQMSFSGQMSYLALHMNNLKPAPEKGFIPLAFLVSSLVELPFMALSGKFIDRMGAMIPLKIACISMTIRMLGYALFPSQSAILCLQLMHGLTFSLFTVAPFAFFASLAPARYRATSLAILGVVSTVAFATTPLIAGRLADRIGIQSLFLFFASCSALGAIILFAFVRQHENTSSEMP